jgi:glycosyltransferase involved in cell wall biosynthesis
MIPRTLLFIVPTVPALTGNGLAMRAALVLQLLAARQDVSLVIVPLHGPVDTPMAPALARLCRHVAVWPGIDAATARAAFFAALQMPWPPDDAAAPAGLDALMRTAPWLADAFTIVHLYRLSTLPFARPWLFGAPRDDARPRPRCHLDLDEVESVSRRRLAALHRASGHDTAARFAALEATRCEALERRILDHVDRVYVCSEAEARHLPGERRADVRVLPNVLPLDTSDADHGRRGVGEGPFRFLFVGTLTFTPNADAVAYFCHEVLPHLRRLVTDELEVTIVGPAPAALAESLASMREVRVVGAVPDVGPWYARADAVIVPLRAGGGTRIKVLEAMRYQRPIVSTTAGIDGYTLHADDDVLVGDTPEAFAAQCARLMRDRTLGSRVSAAAYARYLAHHTPAAAARALDA